MSLNKLSTQKNVLLINYTTNVVTRGLLSFSNCFLDYKDILLHIIDFSNKLSE